MPETALVSVIVPAWNAERVLAEALGSIQNQTYGQLEALIVDDGSTDGTAAIARRFCETDPRFCLVQQHNHGVSAARNAAIERAHGEFIAFLDADDVWLPEKLARQTESLRQDPRANFSFTNFYVWDGKRDLFLWYRPGRPLPEGDASRHLVFANVYPASMSTAMVRRELFETAGLFDPEFGICGDWDLLLRMAEHGLWARGIREPLARYRRWSGNMSNQKLKTAEGDVRLLEKNFRATQRLELRPLYKRSLACARSRLELARARQLLDTRPDAVPAAIWRAWRHYPRRLKWLMRYGLVAWPKFLGGRTTARVVHRKLIQKW